MKYKEKHKEEKNSGTKIVARHPAWLDIEVPAEYEDADLLTILLFFVIHSPCPGQSAHSVPLYKRGWKRKPWYSPSYLKSKIDKAIWGDQTRLLKMVESKRGLAESLNSLDLNDDFYCHREKQRALFTAANAKDCSNEYMSLFYHMRNALAHGRLAMFSTNDDVVFVMEDGKAVGSEQEDKFEMSARMVLYKKSLLRVIKLLEKPPLENEYTEDILNAIDNGMNTKKKIMDELQINEVTYKQNIDKLKADKMIIYDQQRRRWKRSE